MSFSLATRYSAHMGLACLPVGVLAGAWVATTAIGRGYGAFALVAPIAAFLSGSLTWWLMIARSRYYSRLRGASAGAIAAILGHYICWYLFMVSAFFSQSTSRSPLSPGQAMPNPMEAIVWAGAPALWSLVLLGWITLPVGAVLGTLLASRQGASRAVSRTDA
jgi:hypothetical protein